MISRVKILGRFWNFRFVNHLGASDDPCDGNCDNYWSKGRTIRIRRKLTPKNELETTVHECLHAGFEHLNEDCVTEWSRDVAHVLWRLGYRKVDE